MQRLMRRAARRHGFAVVDLPEVFARYAGSDHPLSVIVATLAGVPLYANAAGVIPLAVFAVIRFPNRRLVPGITGILRRYWGLWVGLLLLLAGLGFALLGFALERILNPRLLDE